MNVTSKVDRPDEKSRIDGAEVDFLLVIPCYYESKRLPSFLEKLKQALYLAPFTTHILVVDDGSSVLEQERLLTLVKQENYGQVTLLTPELLPENTGKGGAILHGWRQAHPARWRAFVDADGAVSPMEILIVLTDIHTSPNPKEAYFAVRKPDLAYQVHRTLLRWISGKVFGMLAKMILNSEISDSQCGFKVISTNVFKKIDHHLQGFGFCFDLELLVILRLAKIKVKEVQVNWSEQPGGHLNLFRHGFEMIANLFRIRNSARIKSVEVCGDIKSHPLIAL